MIDHRKKLYFNLSLSKWLLYKAFECLMFVIVGNGGYFLKPFYVVMFVGKGCCYMKLLNVLLLVGKDGCYIKLLNVLLL